MKNDPLISDTRRPKPSRSLPRLGLVLQLFAIILLPLTIILVAITFGSISVHNRAMRNMVGERDLRYVSTSAQALYDQINKRILTLDGVALLFAQNSTQPAYSVFNSVYFLNGYFDKGVAVFDQSGKYLGTSSSDDIWIDLSGNPTSWQAFYSMVKSKGSSFFVVPAPGGWDNYGVIISSFNSPFTLIGAFSIDGLVQYQLKDILASAGDTSVMLVGEDKQVLYKAGNLTDQSTDHPGVAQALQGQSGITYVKVGGDEHVTAYSPVIGVGWALVTEESWEAVSTPTLHTSLIAPLVLIPALLIMLLALYLSASQVVRPLQRLESKASTLANGDYKSINQPVGGIAEIRHLQKELILMAGKVSEAQRSLHGYIGAITAAQEDERKRVARELHDDTLQALIALKQRVQLAQLDLQPESQAASPVSGQLDEIASLTERTIENLRRLTRDLRPAYLEDLGLVPALEMLARETGQSANIPVEFHRQGTERRLDSTLELALYRIAQEACSNILRHAGATQASITIKFTGDSIDISVGDNGVGFTVPVSPAEYTTVGHYGLLGMHERADLIGAALSIHSSPGHGTLLSVTLPLQEKAAV